VQQSTPVGKDANGFDLPHETEWVLWCDCRKQTYGHGYVRKSANGESYECSAVVFANLNTARLENGTLVEVRDDDDSVVLTGEVKEFSKDIAHVRIWL